MPGIIEIKNQIEYQPDAVVSKEIFKSKNGTITLFAFSKGHGLSEHTAPYDATVLIIDGQAQIYISGKKHAVSRGQMIVMPAGKPHALKANQKFKMLLIMIKG